MLRDILENRLIDQLTRNYRPAPHRIHQTHEADAEILEIGEAAPFYLAVTIDSLCEEISSVLYRDPYFIGWMLVTVNLSDLAAVGAQPLGLVSSLNLPEDLPDEYLQNLTRGIADATEAANTYLLGGDMNSAPTLMLSACAVGTVPREEVVTRVGCQPGEYVFLSALAGLGNAFALQQFGGDPHPIPYQPRARIREGTLIRRYASTCMDTSDGVIHTLDQIMRLNHCHITLHSDWEHILHPLAMETCRRSGIPPWLMLAGFHGEFELCYTLPREREAAFREAAKAIGMQPVLLGEIRSGEGLSIQAGKEEIPIDSAYIRNLSRIAGKNPQQYIRELMAYAQTLQLESSMGGSHVTG